MDVYRAIGTVLARIIITVVPPRYHVNVSNDLYRLKDRIDEWGVRIDERNNHTHKWAEHMNERSDQMHNWADRLDERKLEKAEEK